MFYIAEIMFLLTVIQPEEHLIGWDEVNGIWEKSIKIFNFLIRVILKD